MTDFDPDAAAARHTRYRTRDECSACGQPWPCDAAQALDVIREQQAIINDITERHPDIEPLASVRLDHHANYWCGCGQYLTWLINGQRWRLGDARGD